ncbi:MAG: leucyl aminopeptidase family protein, partial [Hyphomonadaceae bacterium]
MDLYKPTPTMTAEPPFARDVSEAPVTIEPIRAADWPRWRDGHAQTLATLAESVDFRGQPGRILLAPGTDGRIERVLFGLGDKPTPMLLGAAAAQLPAGGYRLAPTARDLPPTLALIAWALGGYAFTRYKERAKGAALLLAPDGADAGEARRIAQACYLARDLVNTPANDMGPEALHAAARAVAEACGAEIEAIVGEALLSQNYPLIHAVGRAAAEAPRLLRLSWRGSDAPANAPLVSLVGKGVTFDTGGLNIKPEGGMRAMKKDMGGAAHALALAQ